MEPMEVVVADVEQTMTAQDAALTLARALAKVELVSPVEAQAPLRELLENTLTMVVGARRELPEGILLVLEVAKGILQAKEPGTGVFAS
jgi:hypothetical protein